MAEVEVGTIESLGAGTVKGAGPWAVGNTGEERFAVSRRCRHLRADLADGSIDDDGCLVCPWHRATYDVKTGQMRRGPQGIFAKIPGFEFVEKILTKIMPLRVGSITERDGSVFVD